MDPSGTRSRPVARRLPRGLRKIRTARSGRMRIALRNSQAKRFSSDPGFAECPSAAPICAYDEIALRERASPPPYRPVAGIMRPRKAVDRRTAVQAESTLSCASTSAPSMTRTIGGRAWGVAYPAGRRPDASGGWTVRAPWDVVEPATPGRGPGISLGSGVARICMSVNSCSRAADSAL